MRLAARQRQVLTVVVALLLVAGLWWLQGQGAGPEPVDAGRAVETSVPTDGPRESTDPESGLPVVRAADLPPEARDVLARIDEGGPFKYPRNDGVTFENREELLPDRPPGHYREYTVESSPGDRGPMRIVAGEDGELYWTDDHYQSFSRIAR